MRWFIKALIFGSALLATPALRAWAGPSMIPLIDMGTSTYYGFTGGLYPGGSNTIPPEHAVAGNQRAFEIKPLDENGLPDSEGKYVMLSIGMSNANQEFCGNSLDGVSCNEWTFMGQAAANSDVVSDQMVIVNGARGGGVATAWVSPSSPNYDQIRDELLAPLGLTEEQVQVVWVKVANPNPNTPLPSDNADATILLARMGSIARALRVRYPNLQLVFLSSRIYAGYATVTLNPEPYAYESGFAVKGLIEAQIDQMNGGGIDPRAGNLDYNSAAPWLAWGPYLWADGPDPRSDGLFWIPQDFETDGTHPSQSGEEKAGTLLLDFFLSSPQTACWFRSEQTCHPLFFLPLIISAETASQAPWVIIQAAAD
ncbi:MAG TPA: hypothetical protein VMN57_01830 [Anaerolineales bacterium]|nr:hypothetical protein [Anaerolineales bacterium]